MRWRLYVAHSKGIHDFNHEIKEKLGHKAMGGETGLNRILIKQTVWMCPRCSYVWIKLSGRFLRTEQRTLGFLKRREIS
jgi:hypothetical protein